MYVKSPTGGASWNGLRLEFGWNDDPARLQELVIRVEWNETVGSERTLRAGIRNEGSTSDTEHWRHGPFNGPSPLEIRLSGTEASDIGDRIVLDVGTTTEGPSSVALVDHEVHVTVQETYRCGGDAPPTGRMSR